MESKARRLIRWNVALAVVFLMNATAGHARGGFVDEGWTYRRPIEVVWDDQKGAGEELAVVDFYTAGHHRPAGEDVRIATADGDPVASKVLLVGPGDRVRVLFQLSKGQRKYVAYFGNEKPPAATTPEPKITSGLLLEMKTWTGGAADNFEQVRKSWERSQPVIGGTMIETLFLGINPFGEQQQTISRITGSLFAPIDGDYTFAMTVDDRGALYVDEKPLLFGATGPADIRLNAKTHLTRGRHLLVFYHVNAAGDGRFTVAWKRPDSAVFEVIPRESFGMLFHGNAGALEELKKPLTADFTPSHAGECFYSGGYSHRFHFVARGAKSDRCTYDWDFGDGQTGSGVEVDHVYLADGIYPVTLTVRIGANSNAQTNKIGVSRDYEHLDKPPTDELPVHAKIVEPYAVAKMPPACLPRAALLLVRATKVDPALAVCAPLATEKKHVDPEAAMTALQETTRDALAQGKTDSAVDLWAKVPPDSDLQPRAVKQYAQLLLWRTADFPRAAKALEPYAGSEDMKLKRLYGQALVLAGRADEGRKILQALPVEGAPERQSAMAGALARTIEYYIKENDWEAGEDYWETWQVRYPADFLEGYSVLLKAKLMEMKKANPAAAKVAEAFATAVPGSSYSPSLLDRASNLLAPIDAAHSQALRKMLKERYPEDPLSQDQR